MEELIVWNDFAKIDIRVGTIIDAKIFAEVRNPSYKLWIDFGDLGIKKTSAQITDLYHPKNLLGKQIAAVVNFAPKQIVNFMSECLILGVVGAKKEVILLQPGHVTKNGLRIS